MEPKTDKTNPKPKKRNPIFLIVLAILVIGGGGKTVIKFIFDNAIIFFCLFHSLGVYFYLFAVAE